MQDANGPSDQLRGCSRFHSVCVTCSQLANHCATKKCCVTVIVCLLAQNLHGLTQSLQSIDVLETACVMYILARVTVVVGCPPQLFFSAFPSK